MGNELLERKYTSATYMRQNADRMSEVASSELMIKAESYEAVAAEYRQASGYKDADEQARKNDELAKQFRQRAADAAGTSSSAKSKKLVLSIVAGFFLLLCVIGVIWMFTIIGRPS